jgi:hypothetical protein
VSSLSELCPGRNRKGRRAAGWAGGWIVGGQQAEAERIEDLLMAKARLAVRNMSRLLASKENRDLPGLTEYQVRDVCHRVGAAALDAALEQRKKSDPWDRH